jgi:integrase
MMADIWHDHDLVFAMPDGAPINPDNVRHDFIRLANSAELPIIRIHDLRHTYVTLALLAGVPVKVVSAIIGHKDVSTTLRIYAHVIPEQHGEAATKIGGILYGSR